MIIKERLNNIAYQASCWDPCHCKTDICTCRLESHANRSALQPEVRTAPPNEALVNTHPLNNAGNE